MVPPLDPLGRRLRDEVARLGYDLVDVRLAGSPKRQSVRLRIDRPDSRPGAGVTSEDCTTVTRGLLRWFAEECPEVTVDLLEVSSPGMERPLRWPDHWRRFVGERARVRIVGVPGRVVATIRAVPDDAHVVLEIEGHGERTCALDEITEATLVVDWNRTR